MAFVPGRSATTFALIASQTFTTRRISGASCSALSARALSFVVMLRRYPTIWAAVGRVIAAKPRLSAPNSMVRPDGDLIAEARTESQFQAIPAPEPAWVVPVLRPFRGQQTHGLVGHGDQFGAVDRLGGPVISKAPGQPALRQALGGRERFAVQPRDRRQDGILHLLRHVVVQLPEP